MPNLPAHLLFPFCSSIILVWGLLLVKRASREGSGTWTATFVANQLAALLFSGLWILGGTAQPWQSFWQPTIIAVLYILGQVCTFSAIQRGDVSLATPIFGVKVVIVPCYLMLLGDETLTPSIWIAAAMATIGIAFVQRTGAEFAGDKRQIATTILFALGAANCFACFDLCVQSWTSAWGPGRLLPISFWIVGVLSLGFWPMVRRDLLTPSPARRYLFVGSCLIALQAICIVYALGVYKDAARINVVYALRCLWGVIFAWLVARSWGGAEAKLPTHVMLSRLAGALLLTVAVILIIVRK